MSLGDLSGRRVVDLYAGSGALGIEALSRGAAHVDFVETDHAAREALVENLVALELSARSRLWPVTLPRGLKRLAEPLAAARLVLADPPYGGGPAREILAALGGAGVLAPGTQVVLERHQKDAVPEHAGLLARVRERRYGETVVDLYEVRGGDASQEAELP